MHRDTVEHHRKVKAEGLTLEERIARAAAAAPAHVPAPHAIEQPSLPSATTVPLITMTLDELHDLVYAASSTYLQRLSDMPKAKAQMHAARVAIEAQQIVANLDYIHRGVDPRE
ncbi:hypothetical protein [Aeromicrobium sp. 9AM]|uniref:hypothetical protein n=1 Tax=Aeromicrobium sp. 9AM TaxID=2653126 RepID=UPI0012F1CABA|nr:hypothetical protein [Aeromicrobium sp. 9AM]VXC21023.1 hypothetical protein AERO9AM_50369 [Aeromicrobium sp. 9AM]